MSRAYQVERHMEREEERLQRAYEAGEITRADYNDGLRELQQEARDAYRADMDDAAVAVIGARLCGEPAMKPLQDLGPAQPQFLKMRDLAEYLGYTGRYAVDSAQQFVQRHGIRRYFRSARCAMVKVADVDAAIAGTAKPARALFARRPHVFSAPEA